MKKKGVFNQFKKKALVSITALSVSGLLPAGAALAQGELNAELVASQGTIISGKPGQTIQIPVNIYVTHFGTENHETSAVTVTANFEGKPGKSVSFASNEFNVKKQVMLEYTIPNTTATTVTPSVMMSSTDSTGNNKVVDEVLDEVTINVIQDTTAPTVTLTNLNSVYYNANTLPKKFAFNLDEAGEVVVNGQSTGTYTSGSHESDLPGAVQGLNIVTVKAIDAAGNVSTPVSFTYFYDTINPLVTAAAEPKANANGWYNQNVKVSFNATDVNGSGILSVDPARTISSEGLNQSITGSATDNAGNIGYGSTILNIDKTVPTINGSADRSPNAKGWYNNNVTVSFTAADSLSGIASYTLPKTLTEGANQSVTGTATDKADNAKSTTVSGINIDKTAPTISGSVDRQANANGWYNKDVTVSFAATDSLSGLASYTLPKTLTEGANQSVIGIATDNADNSNSITVPGINIDKTAPVIGGFENGATFMLNQSVNWSASDNLSGLATANGGTLDTSKIGTYKIFATDKAGNTIEKTYSVVYNFGGIVINGSNKAGSTIPVKFQLTDAIGSFIATATARITYAKYTNDVLGQEMDAVSTSNNTTGNLFRYDSASNEYIFNFSTKGLTAGSYLITIYLNDGSTQKVKISLK